MQLRKTIKEVVLKALSENDGQNVKLTTVLIPFDINRTDIRGVLFSLEEDGLIKIDRDYNRLTTKSAGRYYTIGSITLIARLTPVGENYYKGHYVKKEELPTVKIDIEQLQNISHSTINAPVTQFSNDSFTALNKLIIKKEESTITKLSSNIVYPIIVGVIIIVITIVLKYVFDITL
jgi:hypothetical protein